MTDAELIARLREDDTDFWHCDAADRIEALTYAHDTMVHLWAKEAAEKQVALGRIEALTEQLKTVLDREAATTARYDAKMDALEAKLATCEEIGRAFEEDAGQLRNKLAKAVEGLREIASEASVTVHTHNKGGINYTRMYKDWRKLAVKRIDKARATLAEIEGAKG